MRYTEAWVTERARAAYEQGLASFAVHPDRTALLVIDMQDEFVRPGWSPYWVPAATRMAPRLRALVDHCRDRDIPVIWTIFDNTHHGLDRPHALRHLPHGDTDWRRPGPAEVWDQMGYRDDEVLIRKPSYGAFYDTPLDTILRNLGRDTVIVTGTLTNYCCGTTARQAYERGYHVVFGADLTATDDESRQEPELAVLRKGFAQVLRAEEIIDRLANADAPADSCTAMR
ncbi:cysteine hydrolase family protein [Streptoalloteichus hindustanus]|uniref:Nicotinamidase-related amidase n=1 Tax=Streptoalloteichus hindustanus TaxID=2017 RepID=A0A1M5CWD9_STRHI|nr:isochorismatase family cysteine hydrolase [Streptoalloteichus hindustanus]SHF59034.1 Nicotinamidase-related amidase [Streptoalloteichus hindustanus]